MKVLRARYDIPLDQVYAHNWIDYKDTRYCEGCGLATLARMGEVTSRRVRQPKAETSGAGRPIESDRYRLSSPS